MNVQLCTQITQLSDYILFISLQPYDCFDSGTMLYQLFR